MNLLPCPCCNGKAEADAMFGYRELVNGTIKSAPIIYCVDCGLEIRITDESDLEVAMQVATERWNRRVRVVTSKSGS